MKFFLNIFALSKRGFSFSFGKLKPPSKHEMCSVVCKVTHALTIAMTQQSNTEC